ncbi:NADH dehydrogenase [ubiquinone] 1 alpha subcomplex subunit 11 [Ischnura elegans]|uniref:NADH dehydrogenase [ubiquinone] 1 alpha subcomplex subunit 11 n=1 Tax=Ischnura elegans TaxID=197161 RepID=UPI001ED8934F|nr:NADH dehydrogenase [ubiquinone] 1 alpha subcomplex subunit 11 [Ischnura elegans]
MSKINNYYDSPDGEDCFKKLWISSKYATIIGLGAASADVLLHSHPKGYFQTAGRYVYITAPLVGMAATFTVTTCVLTSLRKKDDYINYFLGGAATGSVYGAVKKSGVQGLVASLAFGGAALVLKSFIVNGWSLNPNKYRRAYGGVDHYLNDWTITKAPPRTWKRYPEEELPTN